MFYVCRIGCQLSFMKILNAEVASKLLGAVCLPKVRATSLSRETDLSGYTDKSLDASVFPMQPRGHWLPTMPPFGVQFAVLEEGGRVGQSWGLLCS